MPYTYKNDKPVNTEMFKFPDKYGRTVNIQNEIISAELDDYKRKIGEKVIFPLGDSDFLLFEIETSKKYKSEFSLFVKRYGGLESAALTLRVASKPSNLLEHWLNVKNDKKRETKNEKNTVSEAVSA